MSFLTVNNSTLIISVLAPLVVCMLLPPIMTGIADWGRKAANKQNQKLGVETFNVKFNSLVFGLMIFLVVLLLLATLLFPVLYLCDIPDGPPIGVAVGTAVGFGALTILSGVFLYAVRRWEICVGEEGIKFVPLFGKRKEYSWQDISHVKYTYVNGVACYKVYVNGKKRAAFSFSDIMVGGERFGTMLYQKGLLYGNYFI